MSPKSRALKNTIRQHQAQKIHGYEVRTPYKSELSFFKGRPEVAGMATEDNRIILNPYSTLSDKERQAVLKLEASRLWMNENKIEPDFALTPEQVNKFQNTEYGKNPLALKQSILSRIIVGDPSAGETTSQQRYWADLVCSGMTGKYFKQKVIISKPETIKDPKTIRDPKITFDPEGSGYDYDTAVKYGLKPDKTGHYQSREPSTGQILKGVMHPTFDLTLQGEEEAGYEIYKGKDGKYYSRKK